MREGRHAGGKRPVTQNPEQRPRSRPVNFRLGQRRGLSASLAGLAVTSATLVLVQLGARALRGQVIFQRIIQQAGFGRHPLYQAASLAPRQQSNQESPGARHMFHGRPPRNRLLTDRPNCATSYETPKRKRKPALGPVIPKPGEMCRVVPFASVHERTGAM